MNHIYKVIWNTITQTWVAVSELSRAKGKTKSSKTLSAVVLAATSGILISGQAQSANEVGSAKDNSSVVFGIQSHASHDAVAVGGESNARAYEDVAIGYKATSGAELKIENGKEVTHSSNQSSVAVGTHAQATHVATTAIGAHAQAIHNFATAVGAGAIANHENASAFGEGAKAQGTYSTALGKGALATEDYAVALGKEASSTNTYSTSIGTKANATGQSSLAIGGAAIDSLPIKTNKEGKQYSDLEDGVGAKATGQDSAAIGASANATAKAALAVGKMANASANSTIAVGDQAQASGEKATSIGAGAIAKNEGTIAIGNGAKVGATNGNVAANNGIAIGTESESKNEQAIAVGKKAIAAGNNSIALGNATTTTGGEGVAIGNTASASHHSVAFGSQAKATAEGGYSSAFGNESEANKADSSALGNTAKALAKNATSVGAHSKVTETAENGSALGRSANVSATNGTALGSSSKVEAENGTAVGTSATVSTAGGVALGQGSKSTRAALDGKNITITSQGNIVSSNHITDKDNSPVSDVYAPVKLINDSSILERVKNTIKGTAGAVSLGNDSTTRQLTNLAPGSADSDAVNVAQLKAVVGGIVKYNVTSPDKSITIDSKDETTDGVRKTTFNVTMNTTAVKDAAAWKIKANKETDNQATSVKGGDIVTFKTKDGGNSGDTIKITRNGKELTFEANFATIRTPGTGMVNVDDTVKDNWLAKAKNVAEAINASGWILQANGNKVGLINPGNKVNIATDANSGITITPTNENADGVSTIKLKANVTGLTAGNNVTISSKDGNYTINAIDTNTQASVSPKSGSPITVTKTTTTPNSPDYAVGLNIDDKTLEIKGGKLAARTQAQAIESVEKKDVEDNIAEVDVKSGSTKGAANAVYTVAVTKSAVKDAAAWNIKEGSETTSTAVKGGDTLTLSDTNTIDVVHNGKDFTFNAKTATIQTEQKQAITKIDVSNAGITTKTTGGNNTPTGRFVVPTGNDADKHALATAYDVADKVNQTGWNLYSNGLSPTLINPGDYVNFKSGKATKANIVTEASEGATISYDVNVDNTTIKIDSDGNKLAANTGDVDSVTSTEGNSKKGQVVIHKNPLEPSKTDSGKLATVDTVVKAVNNAKWFTIAKDSDDKVTGETKTNESEGTAMAAGETLGLNAGKNLRLKREANTNNFTFALDSNLKDLDSVHTKEIKLGESNNPISIKNDGDRITYTTKGGDNSDVTHKVANLEDEKHIKPTTDGNEYTVDASGNITMTYADGNNKDVTNTKAVIKGVAKNDLSNITNDGKKAITTLGSVVKAGDNVLVDEDTDAVTGKKTYTVNAVTPVVYTDKKGNRVYKFKKDGVEKFYTKPNGEGEEVTNKDEIIASFYDANNSTTAGAMIVNNIGSAIKNATVPAGKDANNFLNKLEVAASDTGTQNAAVNVSDLHNTADALRSNEIHIAPTTDKTEGKEATHYKYNATTKQVEMTYEDGKGNKVANKKAVIDLSSLADSVHNYGFKANATGHLETGSTAAETEVENGKTVNFDAGKNLTVTQTVDGTSKNHTYSFALSNNIDLTNAGSITMGNTKVDNGGITINATTPVAGETRKPDVTLTNTGLSNGDNHITNVKGNLPDTYNTTEGDKTITKKQDAPTSITKTNAATVGDVLNAGWNLQGNGSDIDFVKPYDTVNFANGTGTTATVTNMDGKTTTVKYDVAVGKGLEVDGDNKVTVKTDGDTITVGEDGKLKANLSTEKVKAADKVGDDDNIATVTPSTTDTSKYGEKGATYEVAVTKSAVKNIAKTAVKVVDGKNTTVTAKDDTSDNSKTYAVNVKGDLTDITSITNAAGNGKVEFKDNGVVNVAGDSPIKLDGKTGDITGLTNKTLDGDNFAKSGRAATEEQLDIVNKKFDNKVSLGGDSGETNKKALSTDGGIKFNVKAAADNKVVTTEATGDDVNIKFSGEEAAKVTNLSYKANKGTAKKVTLENGLDFTNGTHTTAEVGDNGVVKFNVNTATVTVPPAQPDTFTGKFDAPETDGVATIKNVVDVVNNSGWKISQGAESRGIVKAGDEVSFVGTGGTTVTVEGTSGKRTVTVSSTLGAGEKGEITAVTKDNKVGAEKVGQVKPKSEGDKTKVTTVENVANMINAATWYAKAGNDKDAEVSEEDTKADETANQSAAMKAGETLGLKAGKNLRVKRDGTDFTFALNKAVDLTKDGSLTIGNTTVTDGGVTITAKEAGKTNVTLTANGLDNGKNKIVNVAAGEDDNDAVNYKQLKDSISTETVRKADVTDGDNNIVEVDPVAEAGKGTKGATYNISVKESAVKNIAKTAVKVVDGKNTTVTAKDDTSDNSKTYAVNVKGDLTDITSITNAAGNGKVEFKDNGVVNVAGDSPIKLDGKTGDITGLTNKTLDGDNFAKSGRAATEEQLDIVNKKFDNKVSLGGDSGETNKKALSTDGGIKFNVKAAADNKVVTTEATGDDVNIKFSGEEAAKVTNLSYKANKGTAKKVTLENGLDFTNGTHTTAEVGDNGVVKFNVNTATVTVPPAQPDTFTGKFDAPETDGVATIKNVVDVVNNSGWKISQGAESRGIVKAGDEVSFVGTGGTTVTVEGTSGKRTVTVSSTLGAGEKGEITAVTKDNKVGAEKVGQVKPKSEGDKTKVTTVENVANMINAATWYAKAGNDKDAEVSEEDTKADETANQSAAMKAGETLGLKAGKNLRVKRDGTDFTFALNKAVDLTKDGSLTIGNTTVTDGGVTITAKEAGKTNVTLTANGLDNGKNKIVNVAEGTKDTDAVNVAQLKSTERHITPATYAYNDADKSVTLTYTDGNGNLVKDTNAKIDLSSLASKIKDYSFKTSATGSSSNLVGTRTDTTVTSGKSVNFAASDNLTLKQDVKDGNVTYTYGLKNQVVVGEKGTPGADGKPGKDGVDGSIGVNGKDGSAVAINGKDGSIGLNGKDGKNGLTIKGQDGKVGVDGKDGETRLVYVEKADPTKPGSSDKTHELATLDDGQKYAGDNYVAAKDNQAESNVIAKKANERLDIVGGAKGNLTEDNIGVNAKDGKLHVQLAEKVNLGNKGSVTIGDTVVNNNGITINSSADPNGVTNKTVSLTNQGLNNGGNKITNVAEGENDTDAVNVKQLKDFKSEVAEGGLTFAGNSGTAHKAKLNTTVNIKGGEGNTDADQFDKGKNVMTAVNGNTVTVSIKKTPEVEGINIIDTTGKVKVKLTQTSEGLKVSDGNNNATRITNVKAGEKDTDAVNVKQLNAAKTEVTAGDNIDVRSSTGANGQTIYKVSANDTSAAVKGGSDHVKVTKAANTHKDGSTTVTDYTVDLSNKTKEDIKKGVDAHTEVTTKGLTFNADTGTTGVKKLGSKVAVNGDGKNITTTADENGVKVSMKDDIKVNSVTAKEVKVGDVNINENGINAGGKRITNVAPGKDGTDAVNVNQLKYVAGNISNQINNVDKGLRAGIAGALASGGLYHVTTAGKSMVSVGAGTYRGQNALAVGYSRLSDNGKVGVKFTVNSNSQGHAGASASVGYQW